MSESSFYRIEDGSVIVTLHGWDCECMPELGFVIQAGTGIPMPSEPGPPTYTIEALGTTAEAPHTAESIKDAKTTDEEKEQWIEYLASKSIYDQEVVQVDLLRARARTNAIVDRAIRIRKLPKFEDQEKWADRQTSRYGIAVERDTEDDLLLSWIVDHAIKVQADAYKLLIGIAVASGVAPEGMASLEAQFQDHLGRPAWALAATDQETPDSDQ